MRKQIKNVLKNKLIKVIILVVFLICAQCILTITQEGNKISVLCGKLLFSSTVYANTTDSNEGQYIRLPSEELPMRKESNTKYKQITVNKTTDGTKISIKREGAYYTFDNGIFAHADSNVYFDVEEYSQKYRYLIMYVGLNQTSSQGDGVKFWVYTSNTDEFYTGGAQNWTIKENLLTGAVEVDALPRGEAVKVKVDITGAKYLRLQAYQKSGNAADHAVYVDPMLITEEYQEKENEYDITEYDTKIKEYEAKNPNKDRLELLADPEYELLVLQRKFVNCLGNYGLQRFTEESQDNKETIDWLMNDVENLRYYILGGIPTGGYYNSLNVLTRLLKEYKDDFNDTTEISKKGKENLLKRSNSNMGTTRGELYKRMAITISLTHSKDIYLWMHSCQANKSDAVVRYSQYKYMYENGMFKATDAVDITPWFETYNIEEMRYVMNVLLDDEEMIWLNEYTQSKINAAPKNAWGLLTPHSYIAYVWPNYQNPIYYAEENYDYFNELLSVPGKGELQEDGTRAAKKLFDYGITYSNSSSTIKVGKLWMNFRNKFGTGAVCGGISKLGHCIRGSHAIPSAVIGQPGHAAIIYYTQNNGKGYWGIDNDVSGWTQSEKGERMPLGWGNDRTYVKGYNVPYMVLAQEALNDYDNLSKVQELLMTIDLCNTNAEKEAIYNKAIETQSINLDAWAGLINLYLKDDTKTEADYYDLADRMMNSLKYFPFTMANLADRIKPKLTSNEYVFKYTLLYTRMLTYGKNYPNNGYEGEGGAKVLQPGVTRTLASSLLGKTDTSLATFSFDGADAGKIVLGSRFNGSIVRWDYSLDGKQSWKEVDLLAQSDDHKQTLTTAEIESITSANDIYVHIVGANYSEENLYKIDIQESAGLPSTIYANDNENRVIAVNLSTEWRYTENDSWTAYGVASPDLTGDKTVQLRQGATGLYLASKTPQTFTFTQDTDNEGKRKYVPVSHLSIHSVSTQATSNNGAATNAIDANYNTRYHSAWNGTDEQRFMVVKLDTPMYISAVEFIPAGGGNGKIYDGTIYGSMTGKDEDWKILDQVTGWTYANSADTIQQAIGVKKSFEIEEPQKVQYIKIVANRTNGKWFTAREFNFYQDVTANSSPTAGIAYSTTESTNEPVIARLINPSKEITITNNDGKDTYIFTANGSFTFEFEDEEGNEGTVIANVNWIDKDIPTADVTYKLGDDKKLIAVLDNISEDVYLLDQNNNKTNYVEVENGKIVSISYLDKEGNIYKVAELDENMVTKQITYKNTTGKIENVLNYITILQDGEIVSRLGFDNEGNPVTLTETDIQELQILEEVRSNPLEHYLEENTEYEFKLLDKASNLTYKNVRVDYIENNTKILASDITYSNTNLTNQNVIATINPYIIDIEGRNGNVIIIEDNNQEGSAEHTFTENGEYTFKYAEAKENEQDVDREVKTHTASVSWIDKIKPTAEIAYSTKEPTSKVVVTLVNESEEIIITNNAGSREYTFTKNGTFTFEFEDKAGNKKTEIATVDWINEALPCATITYSETELTNQDVIATLTFDKENVTVAEGNTHTFIENGEFTFHYTTEEGNTGTVIAKVDWIEKEGPTATITYNIQELTNQDVMAIISFDKDGVSVIGGIEHIFTENGTFTFEYEDRAGNKGTALAKVNWIDKIAPIAEITYSIQELTNQDVVAVLTNASEEITITNNGANREYTFTENGEFTFEFEDKAGNKGTATAKVDWIKKEYQLLGDINKDGKITATDLLLLKRHLVAGEKQEWLLSQDRFKAGDINEDGEITATDLIQIKRLVLKQIEVQ